MMDHQNCSTLSSLSELFFSFYPARKVLGGRTRKICLFLRTPKPRKAKNNGWKPYIWKESRLDFVWGGFFVSQMSDVSVNSRNPWKKVAIAWALVESIWWYLMISTLPKTNTKLAPEKWEVGKWHVLVARPIFRGKLLAFGSAHVFFWLIFPIV